MIKILFSSLSGFPNDRTGGPNKVINLIAHKLPRDKFKVEFISKHGVYTFNNSDDIKLIKRFDLLRETLFYKSNLYRKIFTSDFYLKKFFERAVNQIAENILESDFNLLNAHDVRTIFNLNIHEKIILSVHSKGSIVQDMKALYGDRKSLNNLYHDFNELEKQALRKVEQIIFPSISAKELYFRDLGLNPADYKSKIIYNCIDTEKINSIKQSSEFLYKFPFLREQKLKILNVANHIKVKNIDKILMILSEFKKRSKEFVFVNIGSGPLTKELKNLVNELNLKNNVIFLPLLDNEDVIRFMKTCDVYISLSERVIFDLVILEALASGMKVIASNDGGNKEIIVDGFNGYLVDIGDTERIINLLEKKDDAFIKSNALETVKKFSIDNFINEYINVYEGKGG